MCQCEKASQFRKQITADITIEQLNMELHQTSHDHIDRCKDLDTQVLTYGEHIVTRLSKTI